MIEIYNISQLQNDKILLESILLKVGLHKENVKSPCSMLGCLLNTLRDDLVVAIEYDYVDSMFRDEYYHYYATKFSSVQRNCARMSIFNPGFIFPNQAVDYTKAREIAESYLGYIVIRPIVRCIGRNVIAVSAKKSGLDNIRICQTRVRTTALGIKVSVCGFPHSSQDGEVLACAETSLWEILAYYGNKYVRYRPVSPFEIMEALRPSLDHRQLPSKGLTFCQIARGLKTFGFSPEFNSLYKKKIIDRKVCWTFDSEQLEVLSCYIESGFPLVFCLEGNQIGHAVVCIGKSKIEEPCISETLMDKVYYFPYKAVSEIVVNDDNVACYQKTHVNTPTDYYSEEIWKDVKLTNFIVPLPSRVYMDALMAINQMKYWLPQFAPEKSCARIFLASCRSFRDHLANSHLLNNDNKNVLLEINLPRFAWICEFGNREDFQNECHTGLIVVDATELSERSCSMLVLMINQDGKGFLYHDCTFKKLALPTTFKLETYNKNIY